jgi:phage-related protein
VKQDRNGVRTAQDLERKYNFSSIEKAIKQSEEGLTKVNNELDNFINATVGELENIHSQIDGQIHTYYYSGVPSMTTPPVTEWPIEEYNIHLGDLYYDKDTGYAYRFVLDGETNEYEWIKAESGEVTEALALANAAKDTADSKRRVFLTQPIPPYDNGDLWISDGDLYVCQISKGEEETYAIKDFIIATKYTDDTVATQVGNELTVVKGQVTTINEKANGLDITITENTSMINSLTEEVVNEIDERKAIIRLQQEGGIPVVELGSSESPVKTKYKNDGMYIETNGTTTTYYKNGKAYNTEMEAEVLVMGNFTWKTRGNGNYSLLFTGGDE